MTSERPEAMPPAFLGSGQLALLFMFSSIKKSLQMNSA